MLGVRRKTTLFGWVIRLAWRVLKYGWVITFGMPRPKRDKRRAPHEYLDLLRPEVSPVGKLVQGFLFIAVFLWILRIQSYVVPSYKNTLQSLVLDHLNFADPWWAAVLTFPFTVVSWLTFPLMALPWTVTLLLLPLAVVFYHRGVFRALLIFTNEPYTDDRKFYSKQLRNGVRAKGPELVMLASLAVAMFLDLIQHVGNPLDHPILNTLAFIAVIASLGSALWAGIKLARWYINDVRERYELLEEFQIESLSELPDEEHGMQKCEARLASTFEARNLPALQRYAESIGYTVTDYDITLLRRTAQLTPVIAAEQEVYETAARNLGKPVYEFDIDFEWVANEEDDRDLYPERLETVTFKKVPVGGMNPDKRHEAFLAIIDGCPKGGNGWTIEDSNRSPIKTLRYGKTLTLAVTVPMRDLLPATYSPERWSNIVLGKDHEDREQGINLKFGPHALVVGPTGAGKTIVLRMIAVRALACGHEVIFIDPMKGGVDFSTIAPWLKMRVTNIIDAGKTMKMIYREVERRKAVLIKHGRGFWADLPEDVRRKENIRPLTVIIDEFTSLILAEEVTKRMAKIEPEEFERAEEANDSKEILRTYAGKIGREARFVGIHLAIAAQRPDAAIFGGEFRSNLTSGVLSVKPNQPPSSQTLGMVFPGTSLDAAEVVKALDDGNQGLALVGAEGGTVQGIKIGFELEDNIAAILNEIGIPRPRVWEVDEDLRGIGEESSSSTEVPVIALAHPQPSTQTTPVAVVEQQADASSLLKELFRKS